MIVLNLPLCQERRDCIDRLLESSSIYPESFLAISMNYFQHRSALETLSTIENAILNENCDISEKFHRAHERENEQALISLLNYADLELELMDDVINDLEGAYHRALPKDFEVKTVSMIPMGLRIMGNKHLWNV